MASVLLKKREAWAPSVLSSAATPSSSQDGVFHIRPSPVARKDKAKGANVQTLCSEDIEKEFREIDALSEDKLRKVSGCDDLCTVERLQLRVSTAEHSVAQLGRALPNLCELVLNGSVVASMRDFGVDLRHLRVLRLASSRVKDLDGVGALDGLRELHLPFNSVRSLTPLALHEKLEVLNLKSNLVTVLNEVDQLGTCFALRSLTLSGNPMANVSPYRRVVRHLLPQLASLDDAAFCKADELPVEESLMSALSSQLEALEAQSDADAPPSPTDAPAALEDEESGEDQESGRFSSSSLLTHGDGGNVVFAGNLAATMRRRKKAAKGTSNQLRLRQLQLQAAAEQDEQEGHKIALAAEDETVIAAEDRELDELLHLSSGLEMELQRLQADEVDVQSPKARLARPPQAQTSSDRNEDEDLSASAVEDNKRPQRRRHRSARPLPVGPADYKPSPRARAHRFHLK